MNVSEFKKVLSDAPDAAIIFMLPDGLKIPEHFHVTEIGRVQKDFIDCGGVIRSSVHCLIQVWVANDLQHRLNTTKLAQILTMSDALLGSNELPIEIEYEAGLITQLFIESAEITSIGVVFTLGYKHTACLASSSCGVNNLCDTSESSHKENSCC